MNHYTIHIDDRSTVKKGIIEMLKEVAKKHKGINVRKLTKKELEAREDEAIARMIEAAEKDGYADTEEVLKEIGLK